MRPDGKFRRMQIRCWPVGNVRTQQPALFRRGLWGLLREDKQIPWRRWGWPMRLMGVFFALSMALLFTAIFTLGFLRRGPRSSVLAFFLIVFLASWAGS